MSTVTTQTIEPTREILRRDGIEAERIYWIDGFKVGYVCADGRAHTAVVDVHRGRLAVVRVLPGWPV